MYLHLGKREKRCIQLNEMRKNEKAYIQVKPLLPTISRMQP